jgi:predicted PurR-regulated permease PerM
MLGMLHTPMTAVWVLLAYFIIQMLQDHVVTPVVQQETVRLPPVILILAQVFMYYWAGILG